MAGWSIQLVLRGADGREPMLNSVQEDFLDVGCNLLDTVRRPDQSGTGGTPRCPTFRSRARNLYVLGGWSPWQLQELRERPPDEDGGAALVPEHYACGGGVAPHLDPLHWK